MKAILNVGLNVGDKPVWDLADVLVSLLIYGINYTYYTIKPSGTENTAVVAIAEELTATQANDLCYILAQDCIAQQLEDGTGMLYGPKAEEWGPFNPEYFLNFDEEKQDEND